MHSRGYGGSGFSLAEVLISLLLLSMLAVVLVGVIPTTIMGLHSASERTTATLLAQTTLESLRGRSLEDVVDESRTPVRHNGVDYQVEVETGPGLSADGSPLPPGLAVDVRVVVQWETKHGPQAHSTRTTMVRPAW